MADVFVSYSKSDKALVESLAGLLRETGLSVWWDTELIPAEEFRNEIRKQISAARVVVVIWSHHSVQSSFVIDEADEARQAGKLVSTVAEGFPPGQVPLGFRNTHIVPLSDGAGIFKGLASRGLTPGKPVSSFLLALFRERIVALKPPSLVRWRSPVAVGAGAVLISAIIGAFLFYKPNPIPATLDKRNPRSDTPYKAKPDTLGDLLYVTLVQDLWATPRTLKIDLIAGEPYYLKGLQTYFIMPDLKLIKKVEDDKVLRVTSVLSPSISIDPDVGRVFAARGYVASCLHMARTSDGAAARVGFVRKINGAKDLYLDAGPVEANVIDELSKEYGCNFIH